MTRSVSASVGSSAASAGRSIPGMVRSASLAIAIIAPVLPPETAASALASFTALIAMPIEVVRARRIAWLGFSLAAIDSGEWTMVTAPSSGRWRVELGLDLGLVAVDDELQRRIAAKRARGARDHPRRAAVAAHCVDCDARAPVHREACRRLGLGRDDFAAVIMAARRAHVVRQLQFAAVGAFLELGRRQRMVAAAHVPLRRRGFSLWDSHCGTFEINKNCDDLRLISAG